MEKFKSMFDGAVEISGTMGAFEGPSTLGPGPDPNSCGTLVQFYRGMPTMPKSSVADRPDLMSPGGENDVTE